MSVLKGIKYVSKVSICTWGAILERSDDCEEGSMAISILSVVIFIYYSLNLVIEVFTREAVCVCYNRLIKDISTLGCIRRSEF